eukprot:CAMPEP_0113944032 /NCGR_PEP_ID=MMETSP1339-20121228/30593_1 /TAXON_ID=94617 /ORGANISM="Fibrocapsa japonica" /LENGTH=171 /DNA_ID=CAMNT_0000949085 /DNA_START=170 /DNA_END=685 /DNA_ORIENTATION=+ /assembly_acc=CAM_ASM_000762
MSVSNGEKNWASTRSIFLREAVTTAAVVLGGAAVWSPKEASAAGLPVGKGGLPQGVLASGNIKKTQKDVAAIIQTLKDRGAELDDTEWKNLGGYLRKIYQVEPDLNFMARTLGKSEKEEAKTLISTYLSALRGADPYVKSKDVEGLLSSQEKAAESLERFQSLFYDVPDEL